MVTNEELDNAFDELLGRGLIRRQMKGGETFYGHTKKFLYFLKMNAIENPSEEVDREAILELLALTILDTGDVEEKMFVNCLLIMELMTKNKTSSRI